jgi:hypothetical protein
MGTMTVRVFDRAAEAASWGLPGGGHPIVRTLTISATCPTCGGVRGKPRSTRSHDDGEWYSVDVWTNDCGHPDPYSAVVREARENGLN